MFPVIEVGTFLKHSKLKFSQTEKYHLKKQNKHTFRDGENLLYSVIMILCGKVAVGP